MIFRSEVRKFQSPKERIVMDMLPDRDRKIYQTFYQFLPVQAFEICSRLKDVKHMGTKIFKMDIMPSQRNFHLMNLTAFE